MRIDILKEFQGGLSSREEGEQLRNRILSILSGAEYVEVDFGDEMIGSASFLDEGLARLVEVIPADQLKNRVRLVNFTEPDRKLLNMLTAIHRREQNPLPKGD